MLINYFNLSYLYFYVLALLYYNKVANFHS